MHLFLVVCGLLLILLASTCGPVGDIFHLGLFCVTFVSQKTGNFMKNALNEDVRFVWPKRSVFGPGKGGDSIATNPRKGYFDVIHY